MKFWLGTHMASWLARLDVPLFVSRRQLEKYRTLPRARREWALDSGGFTELSQHGAWTLTAPDYAALVRRFSEETGNLAWAAPQDWMCEPLQLANTGRTIVDHQRLTIDNYLELRAIDATLPIVPVLQGWLPADYHDHIDQYAARGVDLTCEPIVGLGSVCRRQATSEIHRLIATLADGGLRLHGFGVKTSGLESYGDLLTSADSMAWSFAARKRKLRLPTCTHRGKTCTNCSAWALQWRSDAIGSCGSEDIQLAFA